MNNKSWVAADKINFYQRYGKECWPHPSTPEESIETTPKEIICKLQSRINELELLLKDICEECELKEKRIQSLEEKVFLLTRP
jgi:hypothetical protein